MRGFAGQRRQRCRLWVSVVGVKELALRRKRGGQLRRLHRSAGWSGIGPIERRRARRRDPGWRLGVGSKIERTRSQRLRLSQANTGDVEDLRRSAGQRGQIGRYVIIFVMHDCQGAAARCQNAGCVTRAAQLFVRRDRRPGRSIGMGIARPDVEWPGRKILSPALALSLDRFGPREAARQCHPDYRTHCRQQQCQQNPGGNAQRRCGGRNDQIDMTFEDQAFDQRWANGQTAEAEQGPEPQRHDRRKQRMAGDRHALDRLALLLCHWPLNPCSCHSRLRPLRCSGSGRDAAIHGSG